MKLRSLGFVFLLSSICLSAHQIPEWYRVYTFDESIIEMNTSLVTFINKDISRVRFRWTFDQPEALGGEPQLKYKSRLEVMEFNCSEQRYRPYHLTFFDAAGNIVRIEEMNPREWRSVKSGSFIEKLFTPACELIKQKTHPPVVSSEALELERVAKYALAFSRRLEQAKDFKPVIEKFFAADYLHGYLQDNDTNWFLNLNRDTAAKASRAELQKFYVASLNSGYLFCLYLINQYPVAARGLIPQENLIPPDIVALIDNHPYTATYKGKQDNHEYLAENIDSVERLRSYTNLLERIGVLMRKHVINVRAEHSNEYQTMLEDWDLYHPKVRICGSDYLGLPKGTKIFDVNVPIFHLQLAEIKGELMVISAADYFH